MAILLFSDPETLCEQAKRFTNGNLPVLLMTGESALAEPLQQRLEDLLVIDVQGPRLSRLNFDAVGLAIIDLTPALLLTSGGRRLIDVLGRLASAPDQALHVAFCGAAVGVTGAFLMDALTAGLNLLPQTIVVSDVQAVTDLRTLLSRLSTTNLRLVALAQPIGVQYVSAADTVIATGRGSVLLAAFHQAPGQAQPTARLHALTDGMTSGWP